MILYGLFQVNITQLTANKFQRPKRTAQRFGPEQRSNKASHRIPKPSMGFTGVMPERSSVGRPILRVVWCFFVFLLFFPRLVLFVWCCIGCCSLFAFVLGSWFGLPGVVFSFLSGCQRPFKSFHSHGPLFFKNISI